MYGFHFLLSLLMHPPSVNLGFLSTFAPWNSKKHTGPSAQAPHQPLIADTQCGFKLFTRPSVAHILPLAHIDRWIFDVELLLLAEMASDKALANSRVAQHQREVETLKPLSPSATTHTSASTADASSSTASGTAEPVPNHPLVHGGPPPPADAVHLHSPAEEDLLLALPLPIGEVAVDWHEISGSKVDLLRDSIRMGRDLLVLRANYALGRWQRPRPVPTKPLATSPSGPAV